MANIKYHTARTNKPFKDFNSSKNIPSSNNRKYNQARINKIDIKHTEDLKVVQSKESNKSFSDWIKGALNPLNHLPVVGTVMSFIKKDQDKTSMGQSLIGGLIYGGPLGMITGVGGWIAKNIFFKNTEESVSIKNENPEENISIKNENTEENVSIKTKDNEEISHYLKKNDNLQVTNRINNSRNMLTHGSKQIKNTDTLFQIKNAKSSNTINKKLFKEKSAISMNIKQDELINYSHSNNKKNQENYRLLSSISYQINENNDKQITVNVKA